MGKAGKQCAHGGYPVNPGISAEGLVKRFGTVTALNGVDLQVQGGTVLGLLGPNGSGKTTTVRILSTLLRPDAGTAAVGGYDVVTQAHQVRQNIGLTGQFASVDEKLTGRENLLLIGRLLGLTRTNARQRALDLLTEFQLQDAAHKAAKTYSGGMRRRLDLAASLVGRPPILFLDEPSTGLDPRARLDLWQLVRRLVASGTTVLLTTQYMEEADQLADHIVVLDRGAVIAAGTPEALKARIGARALVVRASRETDVPALVALLGDLTGAPVKVDGLQATAPGGDPDLLPGLVRALKGADICVAEIMVRAASLDDVFLSVTGQHVHTDKAGKDTGEQAP